MAIILYICMCIHTHTQTWWNTYTHLDNTIFLKPFDLHYFTDSNSLTMYTTNILHLFCRWENWDLRLIFQSLLSGYLQSEKRSQIYLLPVQTSICYTVLSPWKWCPAGTSDFIVPNICLESFEIVYTHVINFFSFWGQVLIWTQRI